MGLVFGVIILCSVGKLDENEIKILEELGEDLGFAITSYRAEKDRKRFGAHRRNGKKEWESRFKHHLELGIKLITSRIKHWLCMA